MLNQEIKTKRRFTLGMQIIAFSSVFLLALPWLGYRYMDEMKTFLIQGQSDAQLLAARAIATVLHNRSDLFKAEDLNAEKNLQDNSLHVYPLKYKPVIDGYGSDWNDVLSQKKHFSTESLIYDRTDGENSAVSFGLLLGDNKEYIYGFISVNDNSVIYRHPGYARLDSSDQVRIEIVNQSNEIKRYAILTEAPGTASVYEMEKSWVRPITGNPIYAINAVWKDTRQGYDLELRIPKNLFSDNQQLMISVVDVNSEAERNIDNIVATLSKANATSLNQLITRSAELDRILKGLDYANANICIVDQFRRVRSVLVSDALQSNLCSLTDKIAPELISNTLSGESNTYKSIVTKTETLIITSHPIYQGENIIGTVLVEKNSDNILAKQQQSLNKIIVATVIVFFIALTGILLYSGLLAYRIKNLRNEVSNAIDIDGRLVNDIIASSHNANDEIGELSRGFSALLSQLKSYTGFLESVPRTLRHEILNPLNTISMSLQKMSGDAQFNNKLIDSANIALRQLELIVHSLTEAAHIEDALLQDEKESFDIAHLLSEYVSNIKLKHSENKFTYSGQRSGVTIKGSDLRITQLLDKLKDNAVDFAEIDTGISFDLITEKSHTIISISNIGPCIPQDIIKTLCNNIASHRQGSKETPHLGIGLYVANRIAKHHNGVLSIRNFDDKGVSVSVSLPFSSE